MRIDIREQTRAAAHAEVEHNGAGIALVSLQLAEERAEWSEPVRLKMQVDEDGLIEIMVKREEPA